MKFLDYARALLAHAKILAALSFVSTAATFIPFHLPVRLLLGGAAIVTFAWANFRLYKSLTNEVAGLRTRVEQKLNIKIVQSQYRTSGHCNGKALLVVQLVLAVLNRGPATTLMIREADMPKILLENEMQAYFLNGTKHGRSLTIDQGYSGQVRLSLHLTSTRATIEALPELSGTVVLEEVFCGRIDIPFIAILTQ